MRNPDCAVCTLLPWGACDFHAEEDADECERPDDAPNVDWLVPTP